MNTGHWSRDSRSIAHLSSVLAGVSSDPMRPYTSPSICEYPQIQHWPTRDETLMGEECSEACRVIIPMLMLDECVQNNLLTSPDPHGPLPWWDQGSFLWSFHGMFMANPGQVLQMCVIPIALFLSHRVHIHYISHRAHDYYLNDDLWLCFR